MTIDDQNRIYYQAEDSEEKVGQCHEAGGVWYFEVDEDRFLSREELLEVAFLMNGLEQ